MAFDTPTLGGYNLENPPDNMSVGFEVVNQVNTLADGGVRQRILGYRIKARLSWGSSWIRSQDLTGLMSVANDQTGVAGTGNGALTFTPRPDTKPTLTFDVLWTNKFQFTHHQGDFNTYGGTIELIAPTPTASATDLP